MAYRDNNQHGEAIQLMLEASGMAPFRGMKKLFEGGYWTTEFDRLLAQQGKFSSGERILLHAAKTLWTMEMDMPLMELAALSPHLARLVLGLFLAWMNGPQAVDEWMTLVRGRKQG